MGIVLSGIQLTEKDLSSLIYLRSALIVLVFFFAILTLVLYFKLKIKKILKFQRDSHKIIKMKSIPAIADDKEIMKIQNAEKNRIKKEKEAFEESWKTAMLEKDGATDILFSGSDATSLLEADLFEESDKTDILEGEAMTEILDESLLGMTDRLDETTKLSGEWEKENEGIAKLQFELEKNIEIYEDN